MLISLFLHPVCLIPAFCVNIVWLVDPSHSPLERCYPDCEPFVLRFVTKSDTLCQISTTTPDSLDLLDRSELTKLGHDDSKTLKTCRLVSLSAWFHCLQPGKRQIANPFRVERTEEIFCLPSSPSLLADLEQGHLVLPLSKKDH